MRARRKPKPPRPPRIIAARLVVVALVVGVVLAVVSVPVGAIVLNLRHAGNWPSAVVWYGERGGHLVVVYRQPYATGTVWGVSSEALGPTTTSAEQMRQDGYARLDKDPSPRRVRIVPDDHFGSALSVSAGWPLDAAYYLTWYADTHSGLRTRGVWMTHATGRDWFLPYLPLWPGLLGNTLFYALLVLAPLALLRWRTLRRRARRGLCVACGYELGEGVGACPECGLAASVS